MSEISEFRSPYESIAFAQVSRLLSLGDREAHSKSYGCFDRNFWAWKFTDFPGARFQESAYALAWLYRRQVPGNNCAGNERILQWARAAINYWQSLQHKDGSFDEAYPSEHSLAATAFTGFYVGEAFELLSDAIPVSEISSIRESLGRAGDWLCRNDEQHGVLSNHLAAAAAALTVIAQATGENRHSNRAGYFLDRIYDKQSEEGWYEEYGGADPGYQTHCCFYLARIWQLTRDYRLLESLTRSNHFLKHFIHPNGTLGGEYGSRNTTFYFPAGFEMLAPVCPHAAQIALGLRPALATRTATGLATVDANNFLPMLNNHLFAIDNAESKGIRDSAGELPWRQAGTWRFPDAGLLVHSTARYFSVIGLSKGGVVKAFQREAGTSILDDCGYWARLADGRVVSSQALVRSTGTEIDARRIEIETSFVQVNQKLMSPWLFVGFRCFSLIFGRVRPIAYWVKKKIVHVLITRRRSVPLVLVRRIQLHEDGIEINDEIRRHGGARVVSIKATERFSTIHMGSARYFQFDELETESIPDHSESSAAKLMEEDKLFIQRRWVCGGQP